ncbi:RHS repeat-associated core domain-containing protein [Sphaerisporangium sp. NPDC049003]
MAGLVLMGARLYNPATGRFLQTDPVAGGSSNAYDYCNAEPINSYDTTGMFSVENYSLNRSAAYWYVTFKFTKRETGKVARPADTFASLQSIITASAIGVAINAMVSRVGKHAKPTSVLFRRIGPAVAVAMLLMAIWIKHVASGADAEGRCLRARVGGLKIPWLDIPAGRYQYIWWYSDRC